MNQISLSDVLPVLASHNHVNRLKADTMLGGNFSKQHSRTTVNSHLHDIGVRQITAAMPLSFAKSVSDYSVGCVVFSSSKIQVVWIYTQRVIALVKNPQTIWNVANHFLVREPVRRNPLSATPRSTVASTGCARRPHPATVKAGIFRLVRQWSVLVNILEKLILLAGAASPWETLRSFIHIRHGLNVVSCCRSLISSGSSALRLSISEGIAT